MKKLIPVAFFALLALNTNAINAANATSPTTVAETSIPNEKRAGETESTNVNKVKDSSEKDLKGSESITKSNDSTTMNSKDCLLYTSPSPRDRTRSRMPSSA